MPESDAVCGARMTGFHRREASKARVFVARIGGAVAGRPEVISCVFHHNPRFCCQSLSGVSYLLWCLCFE
jgi:hypothetical protein